MTLEDKIRQLEQEFEQKIKALKEEAQLEQEFPQDGDEYWFIDSTGDVVNSNWESLSFEIDRLEFGHIFKTKEDAEDAVEKFRTEESLREFSRPFINGEDNYHIILIDGEAVQPDMWTIVQSQGAIYFESKEKTEEAIQAVGEERIKKYIFGVE